MKKKKYWAVIDKNGDLLHREVSGQMSVFKERNIADFLAEEWADPKEGLGVIQVIVQEVKT